MYYYQRPPWWFTAIAVITVLPALYMPRLMSGDQSENEMLLRTYPFTTLLAAWLAYRCYATGRTSIAWILIAVSILTSGLIRLL